MGIGILLCFVVAIIAWVILMPYLMLWCENLFRDKEE